MATNNTVNISAAGLVKYDGAGVMSGVTVTQYSPLVGAASNGITSLGPLTNGQLAIGSTGVGPVAAAITAGVGIAVTNGAGTITIATTGSGFTWNDVTGATQTLAVENGYVTDHTNVAYTLPATAALGDTISIVGKLGIASIAQNANQQILLGSSSSTVGVGGSFTATNVGDCIELVCITAGASTVWRADSAVGNWTIV